MNKDLKQQILDSIQGFHLPRYHEITDVGLYLEQSAKFINLYLKPLDQTDLTTSMVSNYVKQKLLGNPIKKQYHTQQLATLFIIAICKNVMALDDIKLLLERSFADDFSTGYDFFCEQFETALKSRFSGQSIKDENPAAAPDQALLYRVITAVVDKIYLDNYIAVYREA